MSAIVAANVQREPPPARVSLDEGLNLSATFKGRPRPSCQRLAQAGERQVVAPTPADTMGRRHYLWPLLSLPFAVHTNRDLAVAAATASRNCCYIRDPSSYQHWSEYSDNLPDYLGARMGQIFAGNPA